MAVSVSVVDAPVHALPPAATTAPPTVPENAAAVSEPPSLLTTALLMTRCAGWSSLVTVQVLVSPGAMLPVQSVEDRKSYAEGAVAATLEVPTLVSVRSVEAPAHVLPPVATTTPPIVPEKATAVSVPPLLLTTTLVMIRCGGWSSLVMVQVLVSPGAIVPVQSVENVAS